MLSLTPGTATFTLPKGTGGLVLAHDPVLRDSPSALDSSPDGSRSLSLDTLLL